MSEEDANVRRDIAQLCNMFSLFCAKPLLTYTQESTGKIILQWIKVKLAVHGISEQNGIRDACSTADCCPLLSIVVHCCPLFSIVVRCCPLLSVVVHCFQLLSIVIHCYPVLSIVIHSAVIETFWMLLCMIRLNHSCVLRQFFGKTNHCWHFSMFSILSTTVSQCPAKVLSESKILNDPILNL